MQRVAIAITTVVLAAGCARIIGADFDDARLAGDAAVIGDGGGDVGIVDDGAVDAHPDAAAIDPKGLGDLELWLTADTQVELDDTFDAASLDAGAFDGSAAFLSQGIAIWRDRSGKAHDGVQLDPATRPLLVRPAGDAGPIVAHFDRSRGACLTPAWSATFGENGATFFVVSRGDVAPILDFESAISGARLTFPWDTRSGDAAPNFVMLALANGARGAARVDLVPGEVQLTTARVRTGGIGGIETWRNGVAQERASLLTDAMPPLSAAGIGCAPNDAVFADGDLVEVLVYGEPLADPAREAVEAYARAKWSLP